MPKPVLHIFAISHYCEKARWALDRAGIGYKLSHLPPGIHREIAKKLGAPGSSLPILEAGGEVLQGSAAIIDWVDAHTADPAKRLTPEGEAGGEARAIEARLDDVAGIHVRRHYYSEALVEYPVTVKPIFTRDISPLYRFIVRRKWDFIRSVMIERMDLGREQFDQSGAILETELDWLDGLLADGREYLAGGCFSRADIAAASLLAPLAAPPEHPTYAGLSVPPRLAAEIAGWQDRPVVGWVRGIYAAYR